VPEARLRRDGRSGTARGKPRAEHLRGAQPARAVAHVVAIRRERTPDGFILHVTGREASTMIINQVFDEVERWLSPG
jgi:hypothetical protein